MKTKKIISFILAFIMIFSTFSGALSVYAGNVKLSKTSATIFVNTKVKIKVKGTSKKVTWVSSNKKIATVSSKGVITGKKAGKVTVTAKVAGKKLKCKVTVKNKVITNNNNNIQQQVATTQPVTPELTVNVSSIDLNIGTTRSVTIKYTGGKSLYYSIENNGICSCSWSKQWNNHTTELIVKPFGSGSTTVKVYDTNGLTAYFTVNVPNLVSLNIPSTPLIVSSSVGSRYQSYEITNISYEVESSSSGLSKIDLYIYGNKVADTSGNNISQTGNVSYKLYKNGMVVKSGSLYIPSVMYGESFSCNETIILQPGDYTLEIARNTI